MTDRYQITGRDHRPVTCLILLTSPHFLVYRHCLVQILLESCVSVTCSRLSFLQYVVNISVNIKEYRGRHYLVLIKLLCTGPVLLFPPLCSQTLVLQTPVESESPEVSFVGSSVLPFQRVVFSSQLKSRSQVTQTNFNFRRVSFSSQVLPATDGSPKVVESTKQASFCVTLRLVTLVREGASQEIIGLQFFY